MLLTSIATAALALTASPAPTLVPLAARQELRADDHGKLDWFKGTFEEALAKAKSEKKLVFIDFWTTWCGWCKKLDKVTYSDDTVVAAMKDIVCLSIDAESETGAPIAKNYPLAGFPTMIVLDPDGSVRDRIVGYLDPTKFKEEIERIRSGKGTLVELRRLVEAEKSSIEKRWNLAKKLKDLGDTKGYDEQVAEIRKLDPKGESEAVHRASFDALIEKLQAAFEGGKGEETPAMMEQFLATEKHTAILWDGWMILANIHGQLAQVAEQTQKTDDKTKHEAGRLKAWCSAWPNVPSDDFVGFGAFLGSNLYEARATLSAADKTFALELGKKLAEKADKDTHALDAVACCYFLNGQKDKALEFARKCVELEPDNEDFKKRVAEFGA